jgi:lipid II:glycine glycyltransferase (peptidoglycan interpeptide bridge formation enzyme)
MYELKKIKDKNTWNKFIEENNFPFYSFLSSWEWWEFKKDLWFPVFNYGIYKNNNLIWIIPLIKTIAKRGTYLFVPHTPLILENYDYFEILKEIKKQLIDITKKEWASFIRFNPPVKNAIENYKKFKELWFRPAPIHEHAEETHLLDLTKSEEELFKQIRKKDRYYINRAIKEWVKVRMDNNPDHIQMLIDLHQKHSKKVGYHPFSEKYIKNLYKHFWNNIRTISTWYDNHLESILMTIKFWKTCVYYIAASNISPVSYTHLTLPTIA